MPASSPKNSASATDLLGRLVLEALGEPPGWHEVRVRPLWEGHFRVNVLLGASATSHRIGHSFFLVTDAAGNVLDSRPGIVKRY